MRLMLRGELWSDWVNGKGNGVSCLGREIVVRGRFIRSTNLPLMVSPSAEGEFV